MAAHPDPLSEADLAVLREVRVRFLLANPPLLQVTPHAFTIPVFLFEQLESVLQRMPRWDDEGQPYTQRMVYRFSHEPREHVIFQGVACLLSDAPDA